MKLSQPSTKSHQTRNPKDASGSRVRLYPRKYRRATSMVTGYIELVTDVGDEFHIYHHHKVTNITLDRSEIPLVFHQCVFFLGWIKPESMTSSQFYTIRA